MMEGDCGPEAGMNWTLIGIILGSVVGAVLIIAVIGIVVSRRSGYNRHNINIRHTGLISLVYRNLQQDR